MLEVKNISYSYPEKPVLKNISFELKKGKILGLLGRTGVGKSTLLRIIKGLVDPAKGEVFFKGEKVFGPKNRLVPGHPGIELVHQDFQLLVLLNLHHRGEKTMHSTNGKGETMLFLIQEK